MRPNAANSACARPGLNSAQGQHQGGSREKRAEIAPPINPGADPLNLCGNARGGSMNTSPKAPIPESTSGPDATVLDTPSGAPVVLHSVRHAFGDLQVLDGVDLE